MYRCRSPLFISFFKVTDPAHPKYRPVLEWIESGPGKLVLGGSQYQQELMKVGSVLRMLSEIEKKGKVKRADKTCVDKDVLDVKKMEPAADFDDPHLVTLIRLTGCKLICVNDPRSHKYLLADSFYGSPKLRPKLYTNHTHKHLLCASNIASCCKE